VKKKWSRELKCVTITTKTKVAKVRTKLKTIRTVDVNASATLPRQCWWHYTTSVLFKLRHAQQTCSNF